MATIRIQTEHIEFIPHIYDTLLYPDRWPDVLQKFSEFCGASGSSLMLGDNVYPSLSRLLVSTSLLSLYKTDYFERYGEMDRNGLRKVLEHPVHTWLTEEEAMGVPASENLGNRFTAEHFGVDRRVGVCLHKNPIWVDGMSLNYATRRGNMTAEEEQVSQTFLPHFSKVLEISRPLFLLKQRYHAVLEALDRLKIGILIITSNLEIIITNAEAENSLSHANGLSKSPYNKLILHPSDLHEQFHQLVQSASNASSPVGFSASLKVPKHTPNLPWLLDIFPLRDSLGAIDKKLMGAIVFITDPDRKDVVSTDGIETLFHLSPAEQEVCKLLVEGNKQAEIAEKRNTSVETVKTQARTLYAKTDTSNQLDLVRLALKVNLPVEKKDT